MYKFVSRSWHPAIDRVKYINKFSIDNWKALDNSEKALANCKACLISRVLDVSDQPQTGEEGRKDDRYYKNSTQPGRNNSVEN